MKPIPMKTIVEYYIIEEEDVALDNYAKVDMAKVFPNTDDYPIERVHLHRGQHW